MLEDNKQLVRRYYQQALGDLSGIEQIVADDFVDHHFPPGLPAGPEGVRQFFAGCAGRASSATCASTSISCSPKGIASTATSRSYARHTGQFAGIAPQGTAIRCPAISTFRIADGKLAEAWELFDSGDLLRQMRE